MPDSWRLAFGTLSAIRVPAPRRVDAAVARGAMLLAPVVGIALGLLAALVLTGVRVLSPDGRAPVAVDLLASALTVTSMAVLTRGLHLDGLADTADGLGVKGTDDDAPARRRAVMRAPDIGAFGVVALVLVVLLQVTALTLCSLAGYGAVSIITAVVVGRLAATWCCTPLVSAARSDGLGAVMARRVPVVAAVLLTVAVLAGAAGLGLLDDDGSPRSALVLVTASLAGLLAGGATLRRCTTRFGGVTGDVMGAVVEVSTTVVLVVAAIAI
jgi:adenosylcobinamide-GDP ribazoletransferase